MVDHTPAELLGTGDDVCNLQYSFLGKVIVHDSISYLISTLSADLGPSCKNTTRILLYSSEFIYLGNYYTLGLLPSGLNENKLIGMDFPVVDLSGGIPDSINAGDWGFLKFEKGK